jgi:hypothetical protein
VAFVADSRRASREVCLHWLPYWLPKIYLPSLVFEYTKTMSIVNWSYRSARERNPFNLLRCVIGCSWDTLT